MSTSTTHRDTTLLPHARTAAVRRWLKHLAVLGATLVLSLAVAVMAWTLLALGIGLTIVYVGLAVLVALFGLAHVHAQARRAMTAWQGATPWEELPPRPFEGRLAGWLGAQVRSPERWRELAYALVGAIADWVVALVAFTWLAAAIAELVSGVAPHLGAFSVVPPNTLMEPETPIRGGLVSSWAAFPGGQAAVQPWMHVADAGIGLLALAASVPIVWGLARAQIGLARAFLAPSRATLARRLDQVEAARAHAASAEAGSLSRIERDLHDGPQQKLIRTSLDLATLARRLDAGEVDTAKQLVTELKDRNDAALAEIRSLARGFAPPVLAEKGLAEAVASLAAASSVPVALSLDLPGPRLPDPVERAVYFAVAEALSNVAKHAHARSASVVVRRTDAGVTAEIADDGTGGATVTPGHGLAGLADRLASLGGTCEVTSAPAGTTVRVAVPQSS